MNISEFCKNMNIDEKSFKKAVGIVKEVDNDLYEDYFMW